MNLNLLECQQILESFHKPDERKRAFAIELVKSLYESVVYKEKFDIDYKDSYGYKFAESIISGGKEVVESIYRTTKPRFTNKSSMETVLAEAQMLAESTVRILFEDAVRQLKEVEISAERGKTTNSIKATSSVFKEFANLKETQLSENGSIMNAVIYNMSDAEKINHAIKVDTFKRCLQESGVDITNLKLQMKINEEFEKSLLS